MNNYTQTDRQLHWLCQILTKANRTFIPKKEDDSHTNLYFDSLGDRIYGRWILTGDRDIIFTLNLGNQQIEILDSTHQVVASVQTISKKIMEVEKEIEVLLPGLGLNAANFSAKLHFEIPNYAFTNDSIPSIDDKSIYEWKHFRQMANEACSILLGHAQVWEEIRIWPHHFDTGIYASLTNNLGLGFGLAMEDEMAGSPYFYMSGYPTNGAINYENIPEGKEWKWELGEHWKGAVLPLDQLKDKTSTDQKQILENYLLDSFNWFVKQG